MKATNPTTRANRRYAVEFSGAMILYIAVLLSTRVAFRGYHGPLETAIALAPMLPIVLVFVAGLRLFQSTDEFNRRLMTDSLAIAGVLTALIAATYGFVEGDPLPRPSAWWTWSVLLFSWLIASIILKLRYR